MYKFCPEIILYSINKFKTISYFKNEDFKKFLDVRYKESLKKSYNEEQLYYYYAIKSLNFESILEETVDIVVESNNQVLISYYLKDNLFNKINIEKLQSKKDEKYWFQNYHLILFTELNNENRVNAIREYLMPEWIRDNSKNKLKIQSKQDRYIKFYESNLKLQVSIINDIEKIKERLEQYIKIKVNERIDVFGIEY